MNLYHAKLIHILKGDERLELSDEDLQVLPSLQWRITAGLMTLFTHSLQQLLNREVPTDTPNRATAIFKFLEST
eukprot:CAMPEP_0198652138 /NCGR_PEP_ID=MMETSP1467-20131203/6170_1 /TAXON_ID=1462469 /ORGANISM="unid. sp., Strain CCMP2135" /LENGTH=73 /DNA_ID=CAMNT_0044388043 /DNA_START=19 /DNA_END=237 /DNA_ORIENTATION=+